MAIIKCKMCGGDLALIEGQSVAECEYCGSRQTVPAADNEKKLNLFASANKLRAACEFDRAAGVYDAIKAEFPSEAEAYWGLVLCKYGIEYVDDPATGKKIPTCHRLSYDSVMDDANLDQAMDCADAVARKVYREEAKQLEKIRTGILEVSSNEKPYDVFICYKETGENGDRTLDSVLAQDIYTALTDKGYRVFFSRITLQSKLGEAYEPYIFAALNSAKVMLAIGTDPEYYSAVWVKNEWSRYLKICAADKSKHLIPCYKDMDAYDMPREFRHLQGVDLGKMGAVQDIIFNMDKYIPLKKNTTVIQEKVVVGNAGGSNKIASLLDRGNMALEDGDWVKADSFFEDVLNNDSKNAQAYLGKALAQEKCRTMDALVRKRKEVTKSVPQITLELQPNLSHIEEMAKKYSLPYYLEEVDIRKLYDFNLQYTSEVSGWEKRYKDEVEYWAVHKLLFRAEKFADENMLSFLLENRCAVYDYIEERRKAAEKKAEDSRAKLEAEYAEHIAECDKQAEKLYNDALACRERDYEKWLEEAKNANDPEFLIKLACSFDGLGDYQDSKNLAGHCRKRAAEEQAKLNAERERQQMIAEQSQKARRKRNKRIAMLSATVALLIVVAVLLVTKVIIPEQTYKKAIALRESGDYMGAVRTFREIRYYKDAQEQLGDFKIVYTKELYKSGKYSDDITYEYDEKGNMILKVNINEDGDVDRYTYEYDENGNLISEEHVGPDWYEYQYTYGYDENGNMLFSKAAYEDGDQKQSTYQYDEKGNLISEVSIDRNGDKYQYAYAYDENGNMIYKEDVRSGGDTYSTQYNYDENGNLVMETQDYGMTGMTTQYTYDSKGNLTYKEERYSSGDISEYAEYTYDKNGNVLTETGENWGDAYEHTFTYDSKGNLYQEWYTAYDGWGKESYNVDWKYYYVYSYDENGNLIREETDCMDSPHNDHWDGSRDSVTAYSGFLAFYCPKDAQ